MFDNMYHAFYDIYIIYSLGFVSVKMVFDLVRHSVKSNGRCISENTTLKQV